MKMKEEKDLWIFLSHSNKDYESVRKVRNLLEDEGRRPLMFFLKKRNRNEKQNTDTTQ